VAQAAEGRLENAQQLTINQLLTRRKKQAMAVLNKAGRKEKTS
jgi:hypothetical protein